MAGKRRLRLGYARLFHEANAFNPLLTSIEDFDRFHHLRGAQLRKACGLRGVEIPGLLRQAELTGFRQAARLDRGVEDVPLISLAQMSSGPIDEASHAQLIERLLASIEAAGELDGLYLALHGAMRVAGEEGDGDAKILRAVRERIGDLPLVVSFDLHVNLTAEKLRYPDLVTMYRTNPHRDMAKVGFRSGRLLARLVREQIAPEMAWRSLPMVMGGGLTMDFLSPMRQVFARMKQMERQHENVLYVNLAMAHVFSDAPDLGWAAHIVTDGDAALAERLAEELADLAWATREQLPPGFGGPAEALEEARGAWWARKLGAISMPDLSDIVGAGAVGANSNLLQYLLEHPSPMRIYLPMREPEAIEDLYGSSPGAQVSLEVGGRIDPENNPRLSIEGRMLGSYETGAAGRAIVLAIGELRLILTEQAPYTMQPGFFHEVGLRVRDADIVVQKSMFHYRFFFHLRSLKHVGVMTQGTTDFECWRQVDFITPVHPAQEIKDWRALDKVRRGISG